MQTRYITDDKFWKQILHDTWDFCRDTRCPICGASDHACRKITDEDTIEYSVQSLRNGKAVSVFDEEENVWLFGYGVVCLECEEQFMYLYNETTDTYDTYSYDDFAEADLFTQTTCGGYVDGRFNGEVLANTLFHLFFALNSFKEGKRDKDSFLHELDICRNSIINSRDCEKQSELEMELAAQLDDLDYDEFISMMNEDADGDRDSNN